MRVVIQRVTHACVKGIIHQEPLPRGVNNSQIYRVQPETLDEAKKTATISICKVKDEIISSIGKGLVVLVGVSGTDNENDINYLTKKVLNLRFFEDENGKKWSKNVMDKEYEVLCISQFTLCYVLKGNKLDFHHAMTPSDAIKFYENFLDSLKKQYKPEKIKCGIFGSYCQVELSNDGPVTINLESPGQQKSQEKLLAT